MIAPNPSSARRSSVSVDGAQISFLRGGTGVPLLFLHGIEGIAGWEPWMEALSAGWDVIVPDHPGWGRSDTPDWFDNVHDLAYFALDFIAALGLDRVHLVGHSIGGWIACEMAVRNTAQIRTLTLVDSAGLRLTGGERFDVFLASREEFTRAAFHEREAAERILAQPLDGDGLDVYLKNRYAGARVGWQPRLYDPHLAKWLHRIDVPVLVVWGAEDRIFPPALLTEFTRLIPGAQSAVLPDCGHFPQVECTAGFITRINAFLNGAHA